MPRINLKSSDSNYGYALEVSSYYIWKQSSKPAK